jgi:hypothetical protein
MPTIQLPKIISINIFLLQSVSRNERHIERNSLNKETIKKITTYLQVRISLQQNLAKDQAGYFITAKKTMIFIFTKQIHIIISLTALSYGVLLSIYPWKEEK